ncbi:MAG: hypothetical protein H6945_00560 [Zoogloeaceae bacterium]|nr:hypothetical protein [Rhodocyclaceae bacterium]MCP5234216.1 hypothetical protein [Zoogloeaceae bacterium]
MSLRPSRTLLACVCVLYLVVAVSILMASFDGLPKIAALLLLALLLPRDLKRVGNAARHQLHFGERLAVVGDDVSWPVEQVRQLGGAIWIGWRDAGGSRRDLMLLADSFERTEDWHLCRLWARQRAAPAGESA